MLLTRLRFAIAFDGVTTACCSARSACRVERTGFISLITAWIHPGKYVTTRKFYLVVDTGTLRDKPRTVYPFNLVPSSINDTRQAINRSLSDSCKGYGSMPIHSQTSGCASADGAHFIACMSLSLSTYAASSIGPSPSPLVTVTSSLWNVHNMS